MKRICLLSLVLALSGVAASSAQDATDARVTELNGRIAALEEAQGSFRKQLAEISQQMDRLRESMNKPQINYATAENLKDLAEKLKEVDTKRVADFNSIKAQLAGINKAVTEATRPPVRPDSPPVRTEKGYEHTVANGETLSAIVQAYRDQKVNVTLQEVIKANPGLKPEKMRVGQVIWIPDPTKH